MGKEGSGDGSSGPHKKNILTGSGREEERSEESWTYNRAEIPYIRYST